MGLINTLPSLYRASLMLGLCLLASSAVLALDPNRPLGDFGHQAWLTENGLPQNTVQSIVQTRDGYLWLATQEGLARFDGQSFVIFDKGNTPEFKSNDIRSLLEDAQGSLWIATSFGLVRFRNGKFTGYTTSEGLPDNSIGQSALTTDGSAWFASSAGLVRFKDEKFGTYTTKEGLSSNSVQDVFADAGGALWILTSGAVDKLKGEQVARMTLPADLEMRTITAIEQDNKGEMWFGTLDGLFAYDGSRTIAYSLAQGLPDTRINSLYKDHAGSLWIATAGGVARMTNGKFSSFTSANGMTSNLALSVFEDREGSIWIGTEAGGLNILKDKKFTTFTTKQGLASDVVKSIYEDQSGKVWVGTNGGGLSVLKDGNFQTYTTSDGLSSNVVLSLFGDNAGNLWIGTPDGLNVFANGKFKTYTVADGLSNDLVRSIFADRSGNIWVGTRSGLNRFTDGAFTIYTTQEGLPNDFIGALYEDRQGNLWIGTLHGLCRFKNGQFTTFTTKDGLSSDTVIAILEDHEGSLWIGTNGGGLNRFRDGKFTAYTTAQGVPDDVVFRILEDQQQNLWCSSSKGVFRLDRKDLASLDAGKTLNATLYGTADGMLTRECSGGGHPSAWETQDGRLWFATVKGIATIDPAKIAINTIPPPVVIEQIRIDDRPVAPGQRIDIAPGSTRFDFYYTALSFIAPENVHFKYKLEGFDKDWIDGGSRRVAYYTALPPGKYVFHVIASNNDGLWNEQGAAFELNLRPHFYQTYWFYALCLLLLVALTWQLYRMRVKQMASQFSAVLAERNRIAREIHDNLAQDILGVSVQLELVTRLMPEGVEKPKAHLDRARVLIRKTMAEARRYVWDLRSTEFEERDLPGALTDTARRLTADRPVQAQVQVTGTFRALAPAIESNLLRIGQEAINNAVKHAEAKRILVDLNFETESVQLSVRDDGRGFNQAVADNGSSDRFGLVGMRERAEQIGGNLVIQSDPQQGTAVIVIVPISQ